MSKAVVRLFVSSALLLFFSAIFGANAFSQEAPFFKEGNLVVTVEGCGVNAGTCTNIPNGTGNGTGNSSNTGYGDNQAAPLTLFQYTPNGTSNATFVNSLVLPQTNSGANFFISGEYGSSSEGTLQLSGGGQYLTIMGYGIDAFDFNADPTLYGIPGGELAQSGSLTGQSYTAIPRVVALIDANGDVNTSTALYNTFNANNPRSAYTFNGLNVYVSGQGTSGDTTGGVFYTNVGGVNNAPTSITGDDGGTNESQDTRTVQIFNNTLYVSMDSKTGSFNRSYIGTLGTPPATSVFSCTGVGAGCPTGDGTIGPALMKGFGNTGGTGRVQLTAGETNGINVAGEFINLSPENYFFASPTVLYVADTGSPKNTSADNETPFSLCGAGGLQKWVNVNGTWTWEYTLYQGLNLVQNANSNSSGTCSTNTSGTTGLYGLTGVVQGNNVYLYATNYTIADLDPTYLYGITDNLTFTTASQASGETFTQLAAAPLDSNFKGVSFAPTIPAGDVEVTTVPSGLTVTTSGTGCAPSSYATPQTLTWTPESSCTLSVVSPQPAGTGVQYAFQDWQDGTTGTSDVVTAPSTTATYTAMFTTQYQLTTTAGTGGSVSAGGFFNAGTNAIVTATPNAGYYFVNFTGTTTSTNNPLTLTMNSPQTITANFAAQTAQAITFTMAPPQSAAYGSSFTVAATGGGSGNPVVFTSAGGCTNVGPAYTMTSATASCSVIANQAGNTDFLAAPQVSLPVSATLATTSINVISVSPSSEDFGLDTTVTITAVLSWSGSGISPTAANISISGNGPSGYGTTSCAAPNGNTITCTNTYTPTTADMPGSYTENATFSGDSNYSTSSSSQTNNFSINIATSTTTVSSSVNPSTVGQSVTFTATINGENGQVARNVVRRALPITRNGLVVQAGIAGSVTWSTNTGCGTTSVTGNPGIATCTTTTLPGGNNTITATYSGDTNHSGSTGTLSGGQTVNQTSQTITFSTKAPATATYNSTFTVVASATSSLPITYSSAGSCTNSGSTYTITSGSGTCTVTASQPGNGSYLPASPVSETTTAERATPTVSLTGAPTDAPFNSSFILVANTNSTATATITATNPTVCQISGNFSPVTVTILKASSSCKFTAAWGADANYTAATATTTSTAVKATPVITWATPAAITYGTPLSATQLDASANVPGTITYAPAAGAIKTTGNNTLKATFVPSVAADYLDASTTVTLEVTPASTTTSITSSSTTVTLNADGVAGATLDFSVSSYRPTGAVTLTASTGESCSGPINATTGDGMCRLTFTSAGPRTITASYGGDSNHTGSNSSAQSPAVTVTVNPK